MENNKQDNSKDDENKKKLDGKTGKNSNKNKNKDKEKFYFFKVDKNKIKLRLKKMKSKVVSRNNMRKKLVLIISLFILIGIGYALYTNTGSDNTEYYNLDTDNIEDSTGYEEEVSESEEVDPAEETLFFGNDELEDLETEEEETVNREDDREASDNRGDDSEASENEISKNEETEDVSQETQSDEESPAEREEEEAETDSRSSEPEVTEETDDSETERESDSTETEGRDETEEDVVTESNQALKEPEEERSGLSLLPPVSGEVIRSSGWFYHPVFEDWRYQNGITLEGNTGDVVMAADSGTVVSVTEDDYRGIMVEIDHGEEWSSVYGHLQKASVSAEEVVGKGQEIGLIGESGITDQPSLYFELQNEEGPVDPLDYFDEK
ncbi:MAG: peptidoglycan DD-metalloendopeptidase family protein [Halanaerobiaceae bacterium]